jgi:hypothetical protein
MSVKDDWENMQTGKALLEPEQQLTFLREFQTADPLETLARMILMKNPQRTASAFRIKRRASQHGYLPNSHTTNSELREAKKEFTPIQINTTKIKALTSVTDDDLEEGIERGNYSQTIISEMGRVMGEDNIFWNVFGDTSISAETDDLLCAGDGWLKRIPEANQLVSKDVDGTNGTFNIDNGVETLFDALYKQLPPSARTRNLVYLCPYEVEDAYRNSQIGRYTPLGDSRLEGYDGLKYKGRPVVYCPVMDDEVGQGLDDTASCILTDPKFLEYNVFKEQTVETKRDTENEKWLFYFRYKGMPSLYMNGRYTVSAKISLDEKADIQEFSRRAPFEVNVTSAPAAGGAGGD